MQSANNQQIFDDLMRTSVGELLSAAGVPAATGTTVALEMEHAAAIGFSGDQVRGAIGLGMQTATLRQLAALSLAPGDDESALLEDWLGECANQLLGRFKNKLLGHGSSVSMALPMVLRGLRMQFVMDDSDGVNTYAFATAGGIVCVWLDVRVNPGFLLNQTMDAELQGPPEGELMLF